MLKLRQKYEFFSKLSCFLLNCQKAIRNLASKTFRSSRLRCPVKKGVLKNFQKLNGKDL